MNLITVSLFWLLSCLTMADTGLRHRKLQSDTITPIPGQYIVELYPKYNPKNETTGLLKAFQDPSSSKQIEITFYYDQVMNGFAMKNFPDQKLSGFLKNPQVKAVWVVSIYNA
jgi:hypothetical protein